LEELLYQLKVAQERMDAAEKLASNPIHAIPDDCCVTMTDGKTPSFPATSTEQLETFMVSYSQMQY
jgi:hypothetical protein